MARMPISVSLLLVFFQALFFFFFVKRETAALALQESSSLLLRGLRKLGETQTSMAVRLSDRKLSLSTMET